MDNVETENDGFFKYIFDLNESNKSNLMNMIQYAVLAFIPIILVLKVTKTYVPEANEEKGSLELLAESLFQVIFILLSFWFINRVITYIPTYSKKAYKEFNETTFIIGFVFILLTLQTKLGEKISILSDRVIEIWSGDASIREETVTKVKVTQPLSGGHQPSQADRLGGYGSMGPQMQPPMAQQIPHTPMMTNNKSQTNNYSIPSRQPVPDFSTMHVPETNALVGATQPGFMEPMAANEAMGSFGGSAW